jgi:hypothetical protein
LTASTLWPEPVKEYGKHGVRNRRKNNGKILDIEAWGSDTVGSVKGQLCQALGWNPSIAFLTFQGYQLLDWLKLDQEQKD